ncbi:hypothetical protein FOPG_19908 [Fusarium oxysporum f. sp. conglutinans race 2 54008]|uniref:Uncharacterized protein n=1 Tax=Fusarium oxysporum f. sp. conglutinans race 2 54008 TaxID=1089457 RepID=X0GV99_FUSOX|nr:hypothetical protein FOPG_19908 [Fusarium oxysporum f. sp. conglutinans race 2 54008]
MIAYPVLEFCQRHNRLAWLSWMSRSTTTSSG